MADQSPKKPAAASEKPAAASKNAAAAGEKPTAVSDKALPAEAEPHVPVTEDAKSAFAAALERKKQAGQARAAHLDGHGGVGGATSSHKATRTFRRKSGSA